MLIDLEQLWALLLNGPYAWPGGYPLYLLTADGEPLSFEAAKQEYNQIEFAMRHNLRRDQWMVIGVEINYEDEELVCCHTGKKIECAYGKAA